MTANRRTSPQRLACGWGAVVVFAMVGLIGCAAGPEGDAATRSRPHPQRHAPNNQAEAGVDATSRLVRPKLAPPPTADHAAIQPLAGLARQRAMIDLADLDEQLQLPDDLRADDANAAQTARAPSKAVKHYVAARDAYQHNDYATAIGLLAQALEADPTSADAYELLGRVYADTGQTRKALSMFTKALQRDAALPVPLFLMGRVAYETENWPRAAALLAHARRSDRAKDPGLHYAATYYLGQSLIRLGYDEAGLQLLEEFLREPEHFSRSTRMYRQIAMLSRQRAGTSLDAGDAAMRLGRVDQALDYYDRAEAMGRASSQVMLGRRVYAALLVGDDDRAGRLTLEYLRGTGARADVHAPVGYLARHTSKRDAFVKAVRQVYHQRQGDATSARAVLAALADDPDAAARFAVEHLKAHPDDLAVFGSLVDLWHDGQADHLLDTALRLIDVHDDRADRYADRLLEVGSPGDWQRHLDGLDESEHPAAAAYLRGRLAAERDDPEEADRWFARALDLNPDMLLAQLGAIEVDLAFGRFEQALTTLNSLATDDQPRLQHLRAMAEFGRGRHDRGIQLMQQLIADHSDVNEYQLTLARMYRSRQPADPGAAEQTLQKLIRSDAHFAPAYEMLFDIYENVRPDARKFTQLLTQARQNIPQSRVTQLNHARLQAARNETAQALSILKGMLDSNPEDAEALALIVGVYGRNDNWLEAYDLLAGLLEREVNNRVALRLFREVCRRTDRMDDYHRLAEQYLAGREPTVSTLVVLAQLRQQQDRHEAALEALNQAVEMAPHRAVLHALRARSLEQLGRHEQAIELLNEAIERDTDRSADLHMALARALALGGRIDQAVATVDRVMATEGIQMPRADLYYQLAASMYGDEAATDAAEQLLLQALEIDPDHAPSLNNLAYTWAEQGRNLARAEKMLRKAVAAERNNAAYLDSLGWVLYKRGQFAEAVQWLGRAHQAPGGEDPVIVDHLGDALWRVGETERARSHWQASLHAIRAAGDGTREEHLDVQPRIERKLSAVDAGKPPELAPIVEQAAEATEAPTPPAPLPPMQ